MSKVVKKQSTKNESVLSSTLMNYEISIRSANTKKHSMNDMSNMNSKNTLNQVIDTIDDNQSTNRSKVSKV